MVGDFQAGWVVAFQEECSASCSDGLTVCAFAKIQANMHVGLDRVWSADRG